MIQNADVIAMNTPPKLKQSCNMMSKTDSHVLPTIYIWDYSFWNHIRKQYKKKNTAIHLPISPQPNNYHSTLYFYESGIF